MTRTVFFPLVLCCASVSSQGPGVFQVLGPAEPIVATIGDDIILPCYLKPNISAEDLEVRWFRKEFLSPVHLYNNGKNNFERQMTSYWGRTALFKDELKKGNTSLKLLQVQSSDHGQYKCFVQLKEPKFEDDSVVQVIVKAIGSQPVISVEAHSDGGLRLVCRSKGWHPEPDLDWLDGERQNLAAAPAVVKRDDSGLFTVSRHIVVQEANDNQYFCEVTQRLLTQTKHAEIVLSGEIFPHYSFWREAFLAVLILFAAFAVGLFLYFRCREGIKFNCVSAENMYKSTDFVAFPTASIMKKMADKRPISVILLGRRWAGKSTSGNRLLGRGALVTETKKCFKAESIVAGRKLTVVMTPGWMAQTEMPQEVENLIKAGTKLCPQGAHALLLVIPERTVLINKGSEVRSQVELLGGEEVRRHTIVLLCCDSVTSYNKLIKRAPELQLSERYHVINNESKDPCQVTSLLDTIEALVEREGRFMQK